MNNKKNKIDILFIGAHSDDVDVVIGGTVILLKEKGFKVEILDLIERKNMYFSEEEKRNQETKSATNLLGVKRYNMNLGLLKLENNYKNRVKIANFIRKKQPDIVITLNKDENHPDHNIAYQLILDSLHFSFSSAIKTKYEPWRVKKVYFYPLDVFYKIPSGNLVFIDISNTFKKKMEVIKSYASQFLYNWYNKKYKLEFIETFNRYLGLLIKKDYAEILISDTPTLDDFIKSLSSNG